MSANWEHKKLGEVCHKITDGTHVTPTYTREGVPFLSVKNLTKGFIDFSDTRFISLEEHQALTKRCKPLRDDILYTKVGTTGIAKVVDVDDEFSIFVSIALLKVKHEIIFNRFLEHFLNAPYAREQAQKRTRGMANKNLVITDIKQIAIHFPKSLSEQRRIVGILDEAFDGIATAKANTENNLQNARALFESHLQSVFSQRNEGWVEKRLGDNSLLEIIDGDRGVNYPKATDFYEEGHCLFLNTKNVRPDGFDFESTMFITAEKDGQLRKGKLKRDDVILTTRGTIGNVGLYSENVPYEDIRINSGMLIFRPNKLSLLPSFLFDLLRSEVVKKQIRKYTTGAAQPQLPIKTLVNFTIPVPKNLEDQHAIVIKLRTFEPETQRLESLYQQKLSALDSLKKSLLHQAFSGQL